MVGLAAGKPDESESGQSESLKISVTDPPLKIISQKQDLESLTQYDEFREEKHKTRRSHCCAWTSLLIGSLILVLLFLGIILFSFFAANMPTFHLSGYTINKLQFDKTNTDVLMTSDIRVTVNITNTKEKMEFQYKSLKADISSDDVFLGKVTLSGFHQKANNSKELNMQAKLNKQPVAEADASSMKSNLASNAFTLDVNLVGVIHYEIHGHRFSGFPFRVSCNDKALATINQKQESCSVKLTPLA